MIGFGLFILLAASGRPLEVDAVKEKLQSLFVGLYKFGHEEDSLIGGSHFGSGLRHPQESLRLSYVLIDRILGHG